MKKTLLLFFLSFIIIRCGSTINGLDLQYVDAFHDEEGTDITMRKLMRKSNINKNLIGFYSENEFLHAKLVPRENVDSLNYPNFIIELSASIDKNIQQDLPLLIMYFKESKFTEPTLQYYYERTQGWAKNDPAFRYLIIIDKGYHPEFTDSINLKSFDIYVDKSDVMSQYIVPYDVTDNHNFMIKQDGKYKYYLGEGGLSMVKKDWGIGW